MQKVKEDRKLVKDSASQKLGNFENAGRNVDLLFNKGVLHYDPSRIFETVSYREIAAEAMKDYMKSREYSNDPAIREIAHFEGRLSPQKLNSIITRSIPDEDIIAMKAIGYRILEFGKFNWNLVLDALHIYKNAFGNVDVPYDYEITAEVIVSNVGFEDRHEGLLLGEIVNGIRIGDIDGYEDTVRRSELDALKFIWGDMRLYQRYRFIPMLLGLKIYKHLYGFPMPQSDFLVPDEPQWPYWMVNMPLGEWTAVARIQQKLIAEHYNHRKEMLDAMEFLWWIPPSGTIPMKYYKQLV